MIVCKNMTYPEINPAHLIERMKEVCGCKTDVQLAEMIGVSELLFYRWRTRNTFHKEIVLALAYSKGVSINHLLFGKPASMISAQLEETEMETFEAICKDQGLTEPGLIRFAISLYHEICERFANGERIEFKGEGRSAAVLVAPMLKVLRARHAPRKPRR